MDLHSLFDDEFLDGVRNDIAYEVKMVVKTLGEQISSSTPSTTTHTLTDMYFSTAFYEQANELGLTEADAIDVFTNGQEVKAGVIVRAFNGYEIGIEYVREQFSAKPFILAIWKHNLL